MLLFHSTSSFFLIPISLFFVDEEKRIYGRMKNDYHAKQEHEREREEICSRNEALLPMDDKEGIEDLIYMRIT
jgi:hypothetical protein